MKLKITLLSLLAFATNASAKSTFSYSVIFPDNEVKQYKFFDKFQVIPLKNGKWLCGVSEMKDNNPVSMVLECIAKGDKGATFQLIISCDDAPDSKVIKLTDGSRRHTIALKCSPYLLPATPDN